MKATIFIQHIKLTQPRRTSFEHFKQREYQNRHYNREGHAKYKTKNTTENHHSKPKFETETNASPTRNPTLRTEVLMRMETKTMVVKAALSPLRARGPALCEGPPCCLRGTLQGSICRRGSCPSGRKFCRRVFGVCFRLRLEAVDPVMVFKCLKLGEI